MLNEKMLKLVLDCWLSHKNVHVYVSLKQINIPITGHSFMMVNVYQYCYWILQILKQLVLKCSKLHGCIQKWASVSINYYRLLSPCHFGVSLLGVKETHTWQIFKAGDWLFSFHFIVNLQILLTDIWQSFSVNWWASAVVNDNS